MNNMGDNNDGAVVGSFNFAAQLPNGKSLTFSGYILAGESLPSINEKLDMAARAIDRQRMIAEVPELEAKLRQLEEAREQMQTMRADIQGKERPSAQEKVQLNTFAVNIAKLDKDIARGAEAVEAARKLAAAA